MLIWMDHVTAHVDGSAALTTTTVKRRNSLPKYGMCMARPLHEPLTQHGPPFQFFNFAPVPAWLAPPPLCSSSRLASSKSFCSSRLLPSAAPSYWTCRRRSSGYWYRSIQFCVLARPPRILSNKWIRPSLSQATFVPLIQTQNPTCRKSQQGPAWMHPIFRMLVSTSNSSSIPESIVNLARANK
jgi:hypothetical protein